MASPYGLEFSDTLVLIMDLEQRTNAWFAARKGKLTASNLGALLGLVTWTSRTEAYRRMMGWSKFEGNAACEYGVQMENTAITSYATATGNIVEASGLHMHEQRKWIAGSPDGLVGSDGMIEVKCPFYNKVPHSRIPSYYYVQINCLLECTKRQWCDFVSWTPGKMTVFRVKRDKELFNWLVENPYKDIWRQVQESRPGITPFKSGEKQLIEEKIQESMSHCIDYDYWEQHKPINVAWSPEPDPFPCSPKKRKYDEFLTVNVTDDTGQHPRLSGVPTDQATLVQT